MMKFWSILANTFVQSIRQPIFCILIIITILVLVIDVPLSGRSMGSDYRKTDQQMLENLGLGTLLTAGMLVAAFSASSAISREIEDRTVLTVIAKPVSRTTFVLGKFAGLTAAVAVAFYLCTIAFLFTVRHHVTPAASDPLDWPVIVLGSAAVVLAVLTALAGNYLFGWAFTSAVVRTAVVLFSAAMGAVLVIGKGWQPIEFAPDVHTWRDVMTALSINPDLPAALLLIFLAVLIFVAAAVAASTRLGQIATILLCLALALVGSQHRAVFGAWGRNVLLLRAVGAGVPNLSYFYSVDALMMEKSIPPAYMGTAALYCLCYVAGILAVGIALFQTRQLEAQQSASSLPGLVNLVAWDGRTEAVVLGAVGLEGLVRLALLGLANLSGFLKTLVFAGALSRAQGVLQGMLEGVGLPWAWYQVLLVAAGLVCLAWALWWFWGCFARGAKWTYLLILPWAVLQLLACAALMQWPAHARNLPVLRDPALRAIAAVLAAVLVLVLVLPRTRRHFRSALQ